MDSLSPLPPHAAVIRPAAAQPYSPFNKDRRFPPSRMASACALLRQSPMGCKEVDDYNHDLALNDER